MEHSSTFARIRSHKLAAAALLLIATGGVAAALPNVRHRAEHLAKHALRRALKPKLVAQSDPGKTTVVAVLADVKPVDTTKADTRFTPLPTAMVAIELKAIVWQGLIALGTSIENHNSPLPSGFESASLTSTPSLDSTPRQAIDSDFATARQAILFYRKGSVSAGDDFAKLVDSPDLKTALEWVAIRFDPREVGAARLRAFVDRHTNWPTLPWLNRRIEESTLDILKDPAAVEAQFATAKPQTLAGQLTLARADRSTADVPAAASIIRDIWRTADINADEEAAILKEFGPLIRRDDHKFRADRLLYKEQTESALRAASLAGPDVRLLALARAAVIRNASADAAIAAVPKALANDAGLLFARIQRARRAGRIDEALKLMTSAPRDPALLVNGDEWWVERRLLARKLLDLGKRQDAYTVCANHAASSDASNIEAEFHAGWIALRFLDDPKTAAGHFARAAVAAATPISRARVAYWQGRAAESMHDVEAAKQFYGAAAAQPISFYGQLASAELGHTSIDLRRATSTSEGDERHEAVRTVEVLYALGERDIALPLAFEIAKTESSDAQVSALAAVLTKAGDARGTLMVGKFATQRGLALDESAFPTFGVPDYQPLGNSADRAVVYAIARQESEFDPKAVSSAGAKGLMQLIPPTARETALKFGVTYDDAKLLSDTVFNAQLGAAHLGQLLNEQRGSYILTFAAYNAGSQRVKTWIEAYGDPRKPGVDAVDWIERIPFTETRNYVQRVFENLQVYRARFGPTSKLLLVGAEAAAPGKGT